VILTIHLKSEKVGIGLDVIQKIVKILKIRLGKIAQIKSKIMMQRMIAVLEKEGIITGMIVCKKILQRF
jgi:hypothetical protein